jgi:hypothetical protein
MFKILILIFVEKKYIKCNILRVAVCPSYIWDARFLKVKHFTSQKHWGRDVHDSCEDKDDFKKHWTQ